MHSSRISCESSPVKEAEGIPLSLNFLDNSFASSLLLQKINPLGRFPE